MRVDDTKYETVYVDAKKLGMMLKLHGFCLGSKKVKVYVKKIWFVCNRNQRNDFSFISDASIIAKDFLLNRMHKTILS